MQAEKKVQKRRGFVSLAVKLNMLVMAIILFLAGGLVTLAYWTNSERVDRYYRQTTSQAAATIAAFGDGDFARELPEKVKTEEFRQVREKAVAEKDETIIRDWLKEQGLYEQYIDYREEMETYRQKLGAKFAYVQSVEGKLAVNLLDPSEDLLYIGSSSPSADEFSAYQSNNSRIEPTVSTTEYGWLCSAYEPVLDSQGRAVALVGVDIDMNDVMRERHQFLISMLIYSGVLLVLSIGLTVALMRKIATRPLSMLADAATGFVDSGKKITKQDVISLPIRSRDEIGDLYREIRSMQTRMVEYMQNLTAVTAEKERIGAELNIATQIQADMLPRIFPPFPERREFDLYASMDPAKEVGGDFYDFFLVDDDHIALVMADVSGKGVPAALFMVIAKTLIKNRAQLGESPAEILNHVNVQLCEGNEAELFVTVWLAIIEISTGKGMAANAGHEHPALCRAGGKYELVEYRHSPAVATLDGLRFREHPFQLCPGDRLFVYTDGVPEATNAHNELFGTDRMLAALNRNTLSDPRDLLTTVRQDLDAFVGEAPQFDDITMLNFYYAGGGKKPVKEITMEATVENMNQALAFVDETLEEMGCPMKTQMQIDVAVEELFVNVASYAYAPGTGQVTIRVGQEDNPKRISVTFIDSGTPYDPTQREDPDVTLSAEERGIGGLGIYMAKKTMDEMIYREEDGKNVLTIRKTI